MSWWRIERPSWWHIPLTVVLCAAYLAAVVLADNWLKPLILLIIVIVVAVAALIWISAQHWCEP